jgi:hypothetical protein
MARQVKSGFISNILRARKNALDQRLASGI